MLGKTLGHYTITAPLGRGGMGEVFQAKDHKLGRDVAIKVLPELQSFLKTYPNSPFASGVASRLEAVNKQTVKIRFHCKPQG